MSAKKAATVPVAVFDVSSASVGGAHALVKRGPSTKPHKITVLAASRRESALQEDITMDRFVSETLKGIETVVTEIRAQDVHHPEAIQLVLASPWYVSQTRAITYKKTTQFTCTEKLINDLIDKEIQHIIAHEKERFGELGKEYTIVEKQISLIKLNGYTTASPYGKKAMNLELYLTVTIAPKKIISSFTDLLHRIYGPRPIAITTSAYTIFVASRDIEQQSFDSVIVDIGEEVTDVAFVKNELFLYQHSFPVGTFELYRAAARATKSTLEESYGLLEAYRLQKLTGSTKQSVAKALNAFAEHWQRGLQEVCDSGHYGFALPRRWNIVVDHRFESIIAETIARDPYIQHRSGIAPSITMITPEYLKMVQNAFDQKLDVPLAIALLFIDRLV